MHHYHRFGARVRTSTVMKLMLDPFIIKLNSEELLSAIENYEYVNLFVSYSCLRRKPPKNNIYFNINCGNA